MMSLLSCINFTYFIATFSLGLLFIYAFAPPPQVIVKFPSPYNAGRVTYTDGSDTCYKYRAEKQEACPADASVVKEQPIAEDFSDQYPKSSSKSSFSSSTQSSSTDAASRRRSEDPLP